jgi:hypothetical protein
MGFYPNTPYRCSLSANYNSSVSGVDATVDFTTEKDYHLFQTMLAGYIDCSDWLLFHSNDKLNDIREAIITEIADACNCDLTDSDIDQEFLGCSHGSSNTLNYTGRITSNIDIESEGLVSFFDDWVSAGPTISVQGVLLRLVQDECYGIVSQVSGDVCPNNRQDSRENVGSAATTGSIIAAAIVFIAIVSGVITIIVYGATRYKRQRQQSIELQQEPPPQTVSNSRRQETLLPLREEDA